MTKQNAQYLTLDEVEHMIDQGVLSFDEDSECSEDEDFEPISNKLPFSSEGSEESSDEDFDEDNELHKETADRTCRYGTH